MIINVSFNASANSAPAAWKQDVQDVARMFASQFTDAVTFTLHVGYGEINGSAMAASALGNSNQPHLAAYTYAGASGIQARMVADALSGDDANSASTLPTSDLLSGDHQYLLNDVEAVALGLLAQPASIDAQVGFSGTAAFDYDRSDGIASGLFDFVGVVAHEISEVMGRIVDVGGVNLGHPSYDILDLFHFSSAGVRNFAATATGYFSIDNGATNLANFNTQTGGDAADWADAGTLPGLPVYAGNDSFLAFSSSSVENSVSETDLREMDILGFNRVFDDIRGDATTARTMTVNSIATGNIEAGLDRDWFAITLAAGQRYVIKEQGVDHSGGTLSDPLLRIYNSNGTLATDFSTFPSKPTINDDAPGGGTFDSEIDFTPFATGTYYIAAGAYGDGVSNGALNLGTYTLKVIQDDFGDDAATASSLGINAGVSGNIAIFGDRDWFGIELTAGVNYLFGERGAFLGNTSYGTLPDPYLRLYDTNSHLITENNNGSGGPEADNKNSIINFTPTTSGTYYLAAGANADATTGTYTLVAFANDDYSNDAATNGRVVVDGSAAASSPGFGSRPGFIEIPGDQDWFAVNLVGQNSYVIRVDGVDGNGGTLPDPDLEIRINYNFFGGTSDLVAGDADSGPGRDAALTFTAPTTGTYYIQVGAHNGSDIGSYTVTARLAAAVVSTFDTDVEDWKVVGDSKSVGWLASGGAPGGQIHWVDGTAGLDSYWAAPLQFLGDKSAFYGGTLSYDIKESGSGYGGVPDVELVGGGLTLVRNLGQAGTDWTHFSIGLDATVGWHLNTLAGIGASVAQVHQVLASLDKILIRAEYVNGAEQGGLDNVVLAPVVDHPPQILGLSNASVAENSPAGTVVGAVSASDPDANETFGFSILGNNSFAFDGANLVVAGRLDFETAQAQLVTVRVTDSHGLTADETFLIAIGNVSPEDVHGTGANQQLHGGPDVDFIAGGKGKQKMFGGAGGDHFVFTALSDSKPGAKHDVIADFDRSSGKFHHSEGDKIDLTGIEHARHMHFHFHPGDPIRPGALEFDKTHHLLTLDINGDGHADFAIVLNNLSHLARGDFIL